MARTLNRLKAKQVETLGAGRHADGGGLYLDRDETGRSRWVFMWTRSGKRREMGLGAASAIGVSLAKAREAAAKAREALANGDDPIEARRVAKREPMCVSLPRRSRDVLDWFSDVEVEEPKPGVAPAS